MSLRASDSVCSTTRFSNEPAFKIELQKNSKSTELRRLRGTFSFDQFISVIRNMWNSAPRRLVIEYDDEDGDRIRIGSELEWQEAVAQAVERGMPAVKLFVRRYKGGKDTKPASDSEDEADDQAAVAPASTTSGRRDAGEPTSHSSPDVVVIDPMPMLSAESSTGSVPRCVPGLDLARVSSGASLLKPSTPEAPAHAPSQSAAREPSPAPIMVPVVEVSGDGQPSENELTIDLLSRLYDCDAAREMMDVFSIVNFAPVVTRRVDGVAQEVHVDVDRAALRHLTVMRTNQWIGSRLYEKAESTLEAASRLWPEDSVILYNLACSASLRGDVHRSMEMLTAAVEAGFDNVQQLRSDPDLEHTRDHPDYVSLLRRAANRTQEQQQEQQPSVVPTSPVPAPTRAAAAAATFAPKKATRVPAELVAQVIAMFPDFTQTDAEALLVAHNNNIRAAINSLLGSA